MSDFRRLVNDLQSMLYSVSAPSPALMQRLASEYDEVCGQANDRLRRCGELLRRGLRSEAIQLCEIEPNLLDLVATLDFPEIPQYMDLCARYELPGPPQLLLETAAELNSAYAEELPLASLLQNHRLLALDRAPLTLRIRTLRSIAKLDPGNPAWEADLRSYEQARYLEIERERAQADRAADLNTLAALRDELITTDWLAPLPPSLKSQVTDSYKRHLRARAAQELEALSAELGAAHSEFDYERIRELREPWERAIRVAEVPADAPWMQAATSALAWFEQEEILAEGAERQRRAVAALAAELEHPNASERSLQTLHHEVDWQGDDIPADLRERYEQRIAAIKRSKRRAGVVKVCAVSAVAVLLGVGVWAMLQRWQFRRQVTENARVLTARLDRGELRDAATFITQIRRDMPRVAADAEFEQVLARFEKAEAEERARAERVDVLFEQLRGVELADVEDAALLELADLVRGPEEESELQKLVDDVEAAKKVAQEKKLLAARGKLDSLEEAVGAMPAMPRDQVDTYSVLDSLAKECLALEAEIADLDPLLRDTLQTRCESLTASIAKRRRSAELEGDIQASLNDPAAFATALRAWASFDSRSSRAKDYLRSADHEQLWLKIGQWNAFAEVWNNTPTAELNPKQASLLQEDLAELISGTPQYPETVLAQEILLYLEAIAAREDVREGSPVRTLKAYLSSDDMIWPYRIETNDNKFYYTSTAPQSAGPENAAAVSVSTPEGAVVLPRATIRKWERMPQKELAASLVELIDSLDDSNWEEKFYGAIDLVCKDRLVDPVGRILILRQLLRAACVGSYPMKQEFGEWLREIEASGVDFVVRWTNTSDPAVVKNNFIVTTSFPYDKKFKDQRERALRVNELRTMLRDAELQEWKWDGWIVQNGEEWEYRTIHEAAAEPYSATVFFYVMAANGAESPPVQSRHGKVEAARFIPAPGSFPLFEGLPVFRSAGQ